MCWNEPSIRIFVNLGEILKCSQADRARGSRHLEKAKCHNQSSELKWFVSWGFCRFLFGCNPLFLFSNWEIGTASIGRVASLPIICMISLPQFPQTVYVCDYLSKLRSVYKKQNRQRPSCTLRGKMPGKCSFQKSWLQNAEWKSWLAECANDPHMAYCTVCKKEINIASMGVTECNQKPLPAWKRR